MSSWLMNRKRELGAARADSEPQQQSVEESSFREMLRHAAGEKNCQIIITTSHDRAIDAYLKQIGVRHLAEFEDDRILQRLSN